MVLKITLAVFIFVKKNEVLAAIPGLMEKGFASDQTAFHIIERSVSFHLSYVTS